MFQKIILVLALGTAIGQHIPAHHAHLPCMYGRMLYHAGLLPMHGEAMYGLAPPPPPGAHHHLMDPYSQHLPHPSPPHPHPHSAYAHALGFPPPQHYGKTFEQVYSALYGQPPPVQQILAPPPSVLAPQPQIVSVQQALPPPLAPPTHYAAQPAAQVPVQISAHAPVAVHLQAQPRPVSYQTQSQLLPPPEYAPAAPAQQSQQPAPPPPPQPSQQRSDTSNWEASTWRPTIKQKVYSPTSISHPSLRSQPAPPPAPVHNPQYAISIHPQQYAPSYSPSSYPTSNLLPVYQDKKKKKKK